MKVSKQTKDHKKARARYGLKSLISGMALKKFQIISKSLIWYCTIVILPFEETGVKLVLSILKKF